MLVTSNLHWSDFQITHMITPRIVLPLGPVTTVTIRTNSITSLNFAISACFDVKFKITYSKFHRQVFFY